MGQLLLLTRVVRLLGVARVVAVAVAVYLWQKQRNRATASAGTERASAR